MILRYLLALLLVASPVAAHARQGIELALIPKAGYITPLDKSSQSEEVWFYSDLQYRELGYRLESGPGYGVALEFRHLPVGVSDPCGLALGPEFLRYAYKVKADGAGELPASAESVAILVAAKLVCVSGNTRVSFGPGIGNVANDFGEDSLFNLVQSAIAVEVGSGRVRGYAELRFVDNTNREYNGSGYGAFFGISMVLRKLPVVKARPRQESAVSETSLPRDEEDFSRFQGGSE